MTLPTIRYLVLSFCLGPVMLAAQSVASHRPATAPPPQHPAPHLLRCPVPPPPLSPKIPPTPASLGCPKVEYALTYIDTRIGAGELAQPQKWYTVAYTGYLADGTKFDSSYDHPDHQPITFPYGAHRVIPGWDTGFEGMHIGGKRRLFIPYQLAYGDQGRPPVIPPKSELIFDVELISQSDTPPAPPALPTQPANPEANPNGGTPPPTSQPQTHPETPQPKATPPSQGNPPGTSPPQ